MAYPKMDNKVMSSAPPAYEIDQIQGQYPTQYPEQYPPQYPEQYPTQYPEQFPAQIMPMQQQPAPLQPDIYPSPYGCSNPGFSNPGGDHTMYTSTTTVTTVNVEAAPNPTLVDKEDFASFSVESIRRGFIRKVFGLLAIQLLITAGIIAMFMYWKDLKEYTLENEWVYWASVGSTLVMMIVLACAGNIRRKFPANIICLLLFTLAMSSMLGTITVYYTGKEILIAVGIVMLITVVMMILGFQTKVDVSGMYGMMSMLTMSLIFFGMFALIFQSEVLYMFYAALGAGLFSVWIFVDIRMMVGGKHKLSTDPEEYIFATLNIYLDIINLLLMILMLTKMCSN